MKKNLKFDEIQDLFYMKAGLDLTKTIHELINFALIKKADIQKLNKWLKRHSDIYKMEKAILYHGTSSEHNIMSEGIKRTTTKSKRSMQSQTGFVYLSLYPDHARTFASFAYPGEDISLYAVEVPIKDLLPDRDQLANKRIWDQENASNIGQTIADSLVFGSGVRIKRDIANYEVRNISSVAD